MDYYGQHKSSGKFYPKGRIPKLTLVLPQRELTVSIGFLPQPKDQIKRMIITL